MRAAGHVRRATPRDLPRVAALWTAITHHHEGLDPVFDMRGDAADELGRLLGALQRDPDAAIFVYEEGSALPGLCIVRIDHAPPIMQEDERAEISDLGVIGDARRRGIGSALLNEALAWVRDRGVARVEVQVAKANREGQAFWRAHGFGDLMDVLHKRL